MALVLKYRAFGVVLAVTIGKFTSVRVICVQDSGAEPGGHSRDGGPAAGLQQPAGCLLQRSGRQPHQERLVAPTRLYSISVPLSGL